MKDLTKEEQETIKVESDDDLDSVFESLMELKEKDCKKLQDAVFESLKCSF